MVKKLKALAGDTGDGQLATTIRDSANQIWLAGLGAFSKAQDEGFKVFNALVKEGEAVQKKAKTAADEKVAEMKETATKTWDKLEKVFEDRVARALHSLSVPTRKDIDTLNHRVAELTAVAKKLSESVDDGADKRHAARKG